MPPQLTEQQIREIIRQEMGSFFRSDRFTFEKSIQISDGRNIQLGVGVGTKIGTATTQKISVYGVTAITQQPAITAPSGGVTTDAEARTAINTIRTTLSNFGIIAA
mgnify:CR=1 FL=1